MFSACALHSTPSVISLSCLCNISPPRDFVFIHASHLYFHSSLPLQPISTIYIFVYGFSFVVLHLVAAIYLNNHYYTSIKQLGCFSTKLYRYDISHLSLHHVCHRYLIRVDPSGFLYHIVIGVFLPCRCNTFSFHF